MAFWGSILLVVQSASTAFVAPRPTFSLATTNTVNSSTQQQSRSAVVCQAATEAESTSIQDANGQEFTKGSVVRVAVEGLKAFQIPPKGQGSYNQDKEFVAGDGTRFLAVPVGLRGTVTKVYDTDTVSANLPVQVKFKPDENTDEGYAAPVAFSMHFMEHEVECV